MEEKIDFRFWMIRSGSGGYLLEEFISNKIIAIGWNDIGEIKAGITSEEIKKLLLSKYTDWSIGKLNQIAGQIFRFVNEVKIGDKVITYDSSSREYYLGEIISECKFSFEFEYNHYREVKWDDYEISRDYLREEIKNSLGSIMTIFELEAKLWKEIIESHPGYTSPEEWEELEEVQKLFEEEQRNQAIEDVLSRSQEYIKDAISKLTWQESEKLVAGLMKTMGYKTKLTNRGSDLGSDIFASPDELGLEEPRVKIEVKKRSKEKISAIDIRSFIGGLRDYNKGVYVSISGFSKEARYEAERSNISITLVDSDWLVELILSNYEKLDIETKQLLPLRKIYWPI